MKLNMIPSEVGERRQEVGTLSYHSVSFKGDISHGKDIHRKTKDRKFSLSGTSFGESDYTSCRARSEVLRFAEGRCYD